MGAIYSCWGLYIGSKTDMFLGGERNRISFKQYGGKRDTDELTYALRRTTTR